VAEAIRQHAPNAVLVVFETLATWFHGSESRLTVS
jgi:hypothetical protein